MRPYGIISPMFWTGNTGKRLRADREAQVFAAYLMTSPHSHQTGIYYLPMMYAAHETGMTQEGASKALQRLIQEGFCEYDERSEWIWVRNMASWQIGSGLSTSDKRCKGVQQYLENLPNLPFLAAFVERYKSDFHLAEISSPIEGASKGLSSNRTGTEQEQEQEGSTRETNARAARLPATPEAKSSKAGRGKAQCQLVPLPEDFALTDRMREQALRRHADCDADAWFEAFCAHHRAHGKAMKDWGSAWVTWIGNGEKFGYPRNKTNGRAAESREMPDVSPNVWGH